MDMKKESPGPYMPGKTGYPGEPQQTPLIRQPVQIVSQTTADFQPGRAKETYPTSPTNK